MARKKQEVALQLEINSQEEWEELMQKEGLIIVDVFQDWCGPCKAVLSFFRRIKNEIGDDFLLFATAKSDTIDSLDKYRGRCEPCFLIYGGGSLVSVVRGANPPALEEMIKSKLEEEHKVMKGEIERKEIKDPYLSGIDVEEKIEKEDKDVEEIDQEVTLALIKPDVVKAGKVEEIISKLKERGIEILAQQERNLTEEEAKSFYHHMENSEYFESLITFLISGPSYILVLAKGDEGIIHEFRELIGPKVFEEAKENAPDSFRAIYGTNSIENAIHGADDKESAHRELAFFFPDFVAPKIARKKQEDSHQQRTLSLIRPAAFAEFKESILEKIKASGFRIAMQKEVKLTKEEAELFYKDHAGKPYFEELTLEMSKGTLLALALEKQHAVSGFRGILGPKDVEKAKENDPSSLRAQFSKEDISINLIHGSDSEENAQNELKYFFPVEQTVAAIKPDGAENREEIMNRIVDARFKIVKSWDAVMSRELAEEFYADQKHQDYFEDLVTHMQSGPTLFMVLSREDAIRGWRSIMGPTDPNIAAESYPDSIRAIYGKDVKENAVYGSADAEEVSRVMHLIFGKLEFNEDGTLFPEYETVVEKSEIVDSEDKTEHQAEESEHIEASDEIHDEPETAEPIKTEDEQEKTISDADHVDSSERSVPEDHTSSEQEAHIDSSERVEHEDHKSSEQEAHVDSSERVEPEDHKSSEQEAHVDSSERVEPEDHKSSEQDVHVDSSERSGHEDHKSSEQDAHVDSSERVEKEDHKSSEQDAHVDSSERVEHEDHKSSEGAGAGLSGTEKVVEPNEVPTEGTEDNKLSEIEQTTEGDLQQDETLAEENDESLLASLGGPMASAYNPHTEEPASLDITVAEEVSESHHDEKTEHSHADTETKEGSNIIIENDVNKKAAHEETSENTHKEDVHSGDDDNTEGKSNNETVTKSEPEIEEDKNKKNADKENEGLHLGQNRHENVEEVDKKDEKDEEHDNNDNTHKNESVVDETAHEEATDHDTKVEVDTAPAEEADNADTATGGDS